MHWSWASSPKCDCLRKASSWEGRANRLSISSDSCSVWGLSSASQRVGLRDIHLYRVHLYQAWLKPWWPRLMTANYLLQLCGQSTRWIHFQQGSFLRQDCLWESLPMSLSWTFDPHDMESFSNVNYWVAQDYFGCKWLKSTLNELREACEFLIRMLGLEKDTEFLIRIEMYLDSRTGHNQGFEWHHKLCLHLLFLSHCSIPKFSNPG